MLDRLLSDESVQTFLAQYPRKDWPQCLHAVLRFGIATALRKYPFTLSLRQLSSLAGLPEGSQSSYQLKVSKRRAPPFQATPGVKEPRTCSLEQATEPAPQLSRVASSKTGGLRSNHQKPRRAKYRYALRS